MADIDKLFEQISSEILTEQTKLEMSVLFENSLNEAIKAKEAALEEANKADMKTFKENLISKMDSYLDLFVEEFTKNNTIAITESVKLKSAEKVLKTFHNVMNDFHLELDENKIDVEEALKESKDQINDLTKKLIEAKKEIKIREKAAIIMEASTKLETDLQKAKLVEFAKGLPKDELFEGKIAAQVKIMLSESKQAPAPKQKLEVAEDKPEFVAESKPSTPVDDYLKSL